MVGYWISLESTRKRTCRQIYCECLGERNLGELPWFWPKKAGDQWYDLMKWVRAALGNGGGNQVFGFGLKLEMPIRPQSGKTEARFINLEVIGYLRNSMQPFSFLSLPSPFPISPAALGSFLSWVSYRRNLYLSSLAQVFAQQVCAEPTTSQIIENRKSRKNKARHCFKSALHCIMNFKIVR